MNRNAQATAAHAPDTESGTRPTPGLYLFLDGLLAFGLVVLLIFGPLAFGAVEAWSRFVLQTGTALLMLLWGFQQLAAGEIRMVGNPLFAPAAIFGLLGVAQLAFHQSAYSYATYEELLRFAGCAGLMFLAAQSLYGEKRLRRVLIALAVFGFALAFFSLAQDLTSNGKLYWVRSPRQGGWIYGPYVNHNHYAGLMEMLFPLPLVMGISVLSGGQKVIALFASLFMAGTIFHSQSRGGMLAFLAQMTFLIGILAVRRRSGRARWAWALGTLCVLLVFVFWLGGDKVLDRISSVREGIEGAAGGTSRLAIAKDSLRMALDRPWLGWGLGVFPHVYPQYRSFYSNSFTNQAHNDYLDVLVETGLLGLAVAVWFLVVLYRNGYHNMRTSRSPFAAAATLAALTACTGIVVHSLTDFNLHIPANAALFFVWCVVATRRPDTQPP